MKKSIIALSLASVSLLSGCITTTDSTPITYTDYKNYTGVSDEDIYGAAVDCALDNFTIPQNNNGFFSYNNEKRMKYSLGFSGTARKYFTSSDYKASMHFSVKKSKAEFKFNNFMTHSDGRWNEIYEEYDLMDIKQKTIDETKNFFTCIDNNI